MEIRVIGDPRDVTGFALAGVEGVECRARAEVEAALARWACDPHVAVIAVSADVAALAPDDIACLRGATDGPMVVVLPAAPASDPATRASA